MNIGIVVAILGVLVATVPTYFLAKSNARDNERQKQAAIDAAVEKAVAPVRQELADAKTTSARLRARVDELQDKLYGRTT